MTKKSRDLHPNSSHLHPNSQDPNSPHPKPNAHDLKIKKLNIASDNKTKPKLLLISPSFYQTLFRKQKTKITSYFPILFQTLFPEKIFSLFLTKYTFLPTIFNYHPKKDI